MELSEEYWARFRAETAARIVASMCSRDRYNPYYASSDCSDAIKIADTLIIQLKQR